MTAKKFQNIALEKLARTAIEHRLGDLSKLPRELADCVFEVYCEFMSGYLNMIRQKENRPADWVPETVSIDPEIADQMRHFFSDYQHLTRKFYSLNQQMNRLRAIDKKSHHKLYDHTIDEILKRFAQQIPPGEHYEITG